MPRVEVDFTISVGNILTVLGSIFIAILIFMSIATANAERDQKLASLDIRVIKNEAIQKDIVIVKQDLIRVQVTQKSNYTHHSRMLERILDHLEK